MHMGARGAWWPTLRTLFLSAMDRILARASLSDSAGSRSRGCMHHMGERFIWPKSEKGLKKKKNQKKEKKKDNIVKTIQLVKNKGERRRGRKKEDNSVGQKKKTIHTHTQSKKKEEKKRMEKKTKKGGDGQFGGKEDRPEVPLQ